MFSIRMPNERGETEQELSEALKRADKCIVEYQEQVKTAKEDLQKKDDLIRALSSMEINHSTHVVESSRNELITAQAKLESAEKKIGDLEEETKNVKSELNEKTAELNRLCEQNRSLQLEVTLLKEAASASENDLKDYECYKTRNEYAVGALQDEIKQLKETICHLKENEVKNLTERECLSGDKNTLELKVSAFFCELKKLLTLESDAEVDEVLKKVQCLQLKNVELVGEKSLLQSELKERESRYVESRDTIRSLLEKSEKEKSDLEQFIKLKNEMISNSDRFNLEKSDLERKVGYLEETLKEKQKRIEELEQANCEKINKLNRSELEMKENAFGKSSAEFAFDSFRESLANILSSAFERCPASEEVIKDRVRGLAQDSKQKGQALLDLEEKMRLLQHQVEANLCTSRDADLKAKRSEQEYLDTRHRLRILEKELANRDVARDELKAEKEKFFRLMQKLSRTLRMDSFSSLETSFALIMDGIQERVEELIKKEGQLGDEHNSTICSLKKKCRELKDQTRSKETHLDLVKKRLAETEEKLRDSERLNEQYAECHGDGGCHKGCELKAKIDRLRRELDLQREENKQLKNSLFECSDIKIAAADQCKQVDELQERSESLEKTRQKQGQIIQDLKSKLDNKESEIVDNRIISENAVQSLSNELRTTRQSLECSRTSERELLEFRAHIGRMLGLAVTSLAIPNYEIIKRLNKLLEKAGIPSGITATPTFHAVRPGFEDSTRLLGRPKQSPRRTANLSGQDEKLKEQLRSISPSVPIRDTRQY